jgi:hypothetical protein
MKPLYSMLSNFNGDCSTLPVTLASTLVTVLLPKSHQRDWPKKISHHSLTDNDCTGSVFAFPPTSLGSDPDKRKKTFEITQPPPHKVENGLSSRGRFYSLWHMGNTQKAVVMITSSSDDPKCFDDVLNFVLFSNVAPISPCMPKLMFVCIYACSPKKPLSTYPAF